MYLLNLAEDGRILSAGVAPEGADDAGWVVVDELPEGDVYEYRYADGTYIYDPLPAPESGEILPTTAERVTALENQLAAYEAAYAQGVSEA